MLRAAFRSFRRIVAPSLRHIELKQSIHVSAVAGAKRYRRAETEFNYKFVNHYEPVESESKQTRNPFLLEEDYSKKTTTELVQAFEDLSFHCHETGTCISNENFDDLLEELTAKVSDLDDEQVMKVLFDLHRFPEAVSSQVSPSQLTFHFSISAEHLRSQLSRSLVGARQNMLQSINGVEIPDGVESVQSVAQTISVEDRSVHWQGTLQGVQTGR